MSLTNVQVGAWNIIGQEPFALRGRHFFVDSVRGSDSWPGTSWAQAKKTIWGTTGGYSCLTTGMNDVLHLAGNATAYSCAAVAPWAKDFTHMIGHTAPIRTGGRVRLTNTVTTATAGEWTISGTGCIFQNIHWQWGASATATSVIGVALSGNGRNSFINCQFEGPTNATVAVGTAIAPVMLTATADNLFHGCAFGGDTAISNSAAGTVILFAGANNNRNVFRDCIITHYNSTTTSSSVLMGANAMSTACWTLFDNCIFQHSAGVAVASTLQMVTGEGALIIKACALTGKGIAVWTATGDASKTQIEIINPLGAATGGLGVHIA